MARPRKPSKLKEFEGNRAKLGKANIAVDVKGRGKPIAPRNLTSHELELWDAVVASLPNGILCAADSSLLERHACAWQRYREAKAALLSEGMVVVSPQGRVRSPWLGILEAAEREMEKSGSQIGLSPVARAKLIPTNEPHEYDLMDFLMGDQTILNDDWEIEQPEQLQPTASTKLVHTRKV